MYMFMCMCVCVYMGFNRMICGTMGSRVVGLFEVVDSATVIANIQFACQVIASHIMRKRCRLRLSFLKFVITDMLMC